MAENKKKKTNTISMILAVVSIALVVWGISAMGDILFGSLKQESVTVTVTEGMSAGEVAHMLKENGVIKNEMLFRLMSKIKGADDKYYAREFEIHKGSGYNELINGLTYQSAYKTTNITIPEGRTLKEIGEIVAKSGYVSEKDFEGALKKEYDYDFLDDIDRDNYLEGYLFPDTYNVSNSMSAEDIVELMLKRFDEVYTDEYKKRAKELGYTDDEIITLASIIEAEAATGADRKLVSGVFHNRLKSKTYPYLESCATVQYILGERKDILSKADTQIKSPYNTYINKGLPLGPVCSPGKASIEAALYPQETDYYFFQSDKDGKMYYAETLLEHEKIRREIQ